MAEEKARVSAAQDEQRAKNEAARKMLEEKRAKAEEEFRQKQQEVQRQKDERQAEMQKRQKEQMAVGRIRMALQKLRLATPENIEELEKKAHEAQEVEAQNIGGALDSIATEAEQALATGRKRVEQLLENRAKEQAKNDEQEKQKAEREAKAKELVADLEAMVEESDAAVGKAKETSKSLIDEGAELDGDLSSEMVAAAEEAVSVAGAKLKACSDFIAIQGSNIRGPAAVLGSQKTQEHLALEALLKRVTVAKGDVDEIFKAVPVAKAKAARRASARARQNELQAAFDEYDKDGDKLLSRAEASAYAKGRFGVALAKQDMDRVFDNYVDEGQKGVSMNNLYLLGSAIGWARERARNDKRKTDRLEKEELVRKTTAKIRAKVKGVAQVVDDANRKLVSVETAVKPLATKAKRMAVDEMRQVACEHDKLVSPVEAAVSAARKAFDSMTEGLPSDTDTIRDVVSKDPEGKRSCATLCRAELRLTRVGTLLRRFREAADAKEVKVKETQRRDALRVIWHNQRLKNLTTDELFEAFDADGDGQVGESDFLAFFKGADLDVTEPSVAPVPPKAKADEAAGGGGDGGDGAEAENGEAAPAEAPAKEAEAEEPAAEVAGASEKAEAKGDAKEAEEAKEPEQKEPEKGPKTPGPEAVAPNVIKPKPKAKVAEQKEDDELKEPKIERIELSPEALSAIFAEVLRGCEASAAFLGKGAMLNFVCVRYVALKGAAVTSELSVDAGESVCKLDPGDVLELIKGPLREESLGVARVNAMVLKNGSVGWVTVVGNQGGKCLQPGGSTFQILKSMPLTGSLEDVGAEDGGAAPDKASKLLCAGERLSVLEGPIKDEASGMMRVRAKVRSSSEVGWVSTASSDGAMLAMPLLLA